MSINRLLPNVLLAFFTLGMGITLADKINPSDAEIAPQERPDVFKQGLEELKKVDQEVQNSPESPASRFNRMRVLFVLGVKEEPFLAEGEKEARWLKTHLKPDSSQSLLLAYEGALRVTSAKHGFNLNRKWENLKAGIPMLDSAVSLSPKHAEIRYLRLVTNYYLPFFMGRKTKVRDDFLALGQLLPAVAREFPPKWYLNVAGFVLEKGKLEATEKEILVSRMNEIRKELKNETL